VSPVDGEVVEARSSGGDTSGQIFGGTVKVREPSGRVYVLRHSEPSVAVGAKVAAGQPIAQVIRWSDAPASSHIHMEVWRTLEGGYSVPNMIDPGGLDWQPYAVGQAQHEMPAPKPPPPHGDTLRLTLGDRTWAGWADAAPALRWVAVHGIDPAQGRAALAWRGSVRRGPKDVTNTARSLVARFLD
jgi:murein DD-endopeptidase MepM/ murein hydrolase activator NlpD